MNILAIDIGTHCGYCYNQGKAVMAGTLHLATAKEVADWGKQRLTRRGDPRICRFKHWLDELLPFNALVFEDVEFVHSRKQAHLWAAFRSVIWLAGCAECDMVVEAVPVGTLKKFATGHGGADKAMMGRALSHYDIPVCFNSLDNNAVDAVWLWLWARQNLAKETI